MLPFQIVQILYWLALSTWFGGVLFVAISAQVIFRTVRESDPLLPTVLSVNLDGQHGTLLAGSILYNLLEMLVRVELVCAGGLLIAVIAQWFVADRTGGQLVNAIIRSALYIAAVIILIYDWRFHSVRTWRARQEYLDNADLPEVANPARDRFDRYGRESLTLLTLLLALLLGMVIFGAGVTAASHAQSYVLHP